MRHLDTRQHIINSASELFYKNGYNHTGINEIIATAEIAKATLYNHFKSKDDICVAYLKYMNDQFLNDILAFCKSKPKGKDQLLALFGFLENFYNSSEFNGCWCVRTAAEVLADNDKVKKEVKIQKLKFLSLINDLLSSNEIIKEGLGKKIYVLYEGAVAESHLHGEVWPIIEAREIVNSIITE